MPIQLGKLLPFGEHQHRVGASRRLEGIGDCLPDAFAAQAIGKAARLRGLAQIKRNLIGADLGVKDRQLGPFFQQVAADANGRCLTGFVDVGFVDAVGRRPYAKPSTA